MFEVYTRAASSGTPHMACGADEDVGAPGQINGAAKAVLVPPQYL